MNLSIEIRKDVIVFSGRLDPEIIFEAKCLNMIAKDGSIIADPRYVHPVGIKAFLDFACQNLMKSPLEEVRRKDVLSEIRAMYTAAFDEFKNRYKGKMPVWKGKEGLMRHQLHDGMYVMNLNSVYLGWEMGLGKSIASILPAILEPEKYNRVLIVCPANVKRGWLHDMKSDWGLDPTEWTMYDSVSSQCIVSYFDERFVLVNYDILGKYEKEIMEKPFDMIICDEAHMVKNDKTLNYANIYKIISNNPDAKLVLISGTPASNRMNDLIAPLKLSRHPLGDNRKAFEDRYLLRGARNKVIGAMNQEELHRRMASWMIRRTQAKTIGLQKVIFSRFYFPLGKYKEQYDKIIAEIKEERADFEAFVHTNSDIIKEWNLLCEAYDKARRDHGDTSESRGIASAKRKFRDENWDVIDRYLSDDGLKSTTHIMSLNAITAMAKVPGVISHVEELLGSKREAFEDGSGRAPKVVIFGGFTKPLQMLKDHFGDRAVLITGSVNSEQRHEAKDRFINDPKCEVFIGNMKAAGVGINGLQDVCNDAVFINMPLVPMDFEQALARLNRKGQKLGVRCGIMLCEASIDEMLYDLVAEKASDIHKVIDHNQERVIDYNAISKLLIEE